MTRSGKLLPISSKAGCSRAGERWCPSRFHRARTKGGRPSYPEIEAVRFAHSVLSEDGHPLCDPISEPVPKFAVMEFGGAEVPSRTGFAAPFPSRNHVPTRPKRAYLEFRDGLSVTKYYR